MFDTMTLSLATVFAGMLFFPYLLRARKRPRKLPVQPDSRPRYAPASAGIEHQWTPEVPERRGSDRRTAERRVADLPLPPGQPDRRQGDRRQAERRHAQTALLDRERRAVVRAASDAAPSEERQALIQRLDEQARKRLEIERLLAVPEPGVSGAMAPDRRDPPNWPR
jgi:hypothetical protein